MKEIWDKAYAETPLEKIPWQRTQFDWFKELVDNGEIKGKTALSLGCGTGIKSIYLAEHSNFEKIIGIDVSEKAIKYAKQNANGNETCEFIAHDAADLGFLGDETFDFILDWASLHGIPEEKRLQYIQQIDEHSKSGTILLIRAFSKKGVEEDYFIGKTVGPQIKTYLFSKKDLVSLFPNFEILKENESRPIGTPRAHMYFIELLMRKKS